MNAKTEITQTDIRSSIKKDSHDCQHFCKGIKLMIKSTILVSAFIASALPVAVAAQDLKPLQASAFNLGKQSAVVYYTGNSNNYEVVTTIGPNLDNIGEPIRYVASVAPGQSYRIEVGSSDRGRPYMLTITRVNDTLSVNAIDSKGHLVRAMDEWEEAEFAAFIETPVKSN